MELAKVSFASWDKNAFTWVLLFRVHTIIIHIGPFLQAQTFWYLFISDIAIYLF